MSHSINDAVNNKFALDEVLKSLQIAVASHQEAWSKYALQHAEIKKKEMSSRPAPLAQSLVNTGSDVDSVSVAIASKHMLTLGFDLGELCGPDLTKVRVDSNRDDLPLLEKVKPELLSHESLSRSNKSSPKAARMPKAPDSESVLDVNKFTGPQLIELIERQYDDALAPTAAPAATASRDVAEAIANVVSSVQPTKASPDGVSATPPKSPTSSTAKSSKHFDVNKLSAEDLMSVMKAKESVMAKHRWRMSLVESGDLSVLQECPVVPQGESTMGGIGAGDDGDDGYGGIGEQITTAKGSATCPLGYTAVDTERRRTAETATEASSTMQHDGGSCVVCSSTECLRCAGCTLAVFYCSSDHQRADWKRHKKECRANKKTKPMQVEGRLKAELSMESRVDANLGTPVVGNAVPCIASTEPIKISSDNAENTASGCTFSNSLSNGRPPVTGVCPVTGAVVGPNGDHDVKSSPSLSSRQTDTHDDNNRPSTMSQAWSSPFHRPLSRNDLTDLSSADLQSIIEAQQRAVAEHKRKYDAAKNGDMSVLEGCPVVGESGREEGTRAPGDVVDRDYSQNDNAGNGVGGGGGGKCPYGIDGANNKSKQTSGQKGDLNWKAPDGVDTGDCPVGCAQQ